MQRIVFVCRGNLVRSVIAKCIWNRFFSDHMPAEAYGTKVDSQAYQGLKVKSFPQMEPLIRELAKYDIDISQEKCKQLSPPELIGAYKIVVMTEIEDIPIWLEHYKYEYWKISNPKIITAEIAHLLYEVINQKVLTLSKAILYGKSM